MSRVSSRSPTSAPARSAPSTARTGRFPPRSRRSTATLPAPRRLPLSSRPRRWRISTLSLPSNPDGDTGMADFDLVLKGTVVLADRIVEGGHVAVRDGKVAHVGQGAMPAAKEQHDLSGALILPGAIDAQVHSLSQKNQEDFIWSTRSAAA